MEPTIPAGWYPDPAGRYQHRWWNGADWTDHVGRNGVQDYDPLIAAREQSAAVKEAAPQEATVAVEISPAQTARPQASTSEKITTFNGKRLAEQLRAENAELTTRLARLEHTLAQMGGLEAAEVSAQTARLRDTKLETEQEIRAARTELDALREQLVTDRQRVDLETEFGIYDYEHPAETSAALAADLEMVRGQIKSLNQAGRATRAATNFHYNNSIAQGRTFVNQSSRIMLRWYNAEAEAAVKAVRAGNLESAMKRLSRVQAQVAQQGERVEARLTDEYHHLRLQELGLAARHLQAVSAERERDREHRAELREQRRVEQEIAREKERLAKERAHYENSIHRLRSSGDENGAQELESRLREIDEAIAQADYRAANIRAGYVYVISNIGAFGQGVVKIGMTRRLEPMDRVRELGDASVPFRFDVHALFFSDDAINIETMLHREFAQQRINKVNLRWEFFRVTPEQVLEVLREHRVSVLEFRVDPQAEEYRASASPRDRLHSDVPSIS